MTKNDLLSLVKNLYNWYSPADMSKEGFSDDLIDLMQTDRNRLALKRITAKDCLLGGYILGFGIRERLISEERYSELENSLRYVEPLKLASTLEIMPTQIPNTIEKNGIKEKVIELIKIEEEREEYLIPVHRLGYFELKPLEKPKLSEVTQEDLLRIYRASNNPKYLEALLESFKLNIDKMLVKYRDIWGEVGYEALLTSAKRGAQEGIDKYDFTKGFKLTTYIPKKINSAILDHLRENDVVPRLVRNLVRRINEEKDDIDQVNPKDLAEKYKVSISTLESAFRVIRNGNHGEVSIFFDKGEGDNRGERSEHLRIPKSRTINNSGLNQLENREILDKAMAELDPTERSIVINYYFEHIPMKDIGALLNISESRVSQMMSDLLPRMKLALNRIGIESYAAS